MTRVVPFVAVALLLACSSMPAQNSSDVAARIGDRTVTVRELDDRWRASDPAEHSEAVQKLYDGRRGALEAIVAEMLVTEAAKSRGLSPEAYIQAELGKRTTPVTDQEVATFYDANIGQMDGRPLSAMAPAINRFLTQQREDAARLSLINDLRKGGPSVRVMIEAPRFDLELSSDDPALGNEKAPVTVVEFSDFQCPYCLRAAPTLRKIREQYGDKVRLVWKDFPLTQIHPEAFKAGEAGHCAAEQGKFWDYHDQLFGNQTALRPDDLKQHAATVGLDVGKFNACLDSSKYAERVRDGVAQGTRLGVNSTPTVFINGRRVSGAQAYDVFAAVIEEELAR